MIGAYLPQEVSQREQLAVLANTCQAGSSQTPRVNRAPVQVSHAHHTRHSNPRSGPFPNHEHYEDDLIVCCAQPCSPIVPVFLSQLSRPRPPTSVVPTLALHADPTKHTFIHHRCRSCGSHKMHLFLVHCWCGHIREHDDRRILIRVRMPPS